MELHKNKVSYKKPRGLLIKPQQHKSEREQAPWSYNRPCVE